MNFITRHHQIPTLELKNSESIKVQIKQEVDGISVQLEDEVNQVDTNNTSTDGEMIDEKEDNEAILNRRSWQTIDLLSKPTSSAFSESIEKHLPRMLEILFIDSFAPDNTQCNYFHFMKLMENLLTNHRARIFEVLRRKNLVFNCLVPALSRHPMIVHLLLYLIEMSQPLTSSNGNNFVIKRRFQAHLAENELLQVILRHIYTSATSDAPGM